MIVDERKRDIEHVLESNSHQEFYTTFTPSQQWPFKERSSHCRLLILDSSFNPPTRAHANLLEKALQAYPADYFNGSLLLFSTQNVDKALTGATVMQRAQMMELVARQYPNTAVGLTPHGRFVDKADCIRSWCVNQQHQFNISQLELYFIVGYDTLIRLVDPKYYNGKPVKEALAPFFETCHLICADRNQTEDADFWAHFYHLVDDASLIKRIKLDKDTAQLSSTLAREAVHCQDTSILQQVLDPHVAQFVKEHKIYLL